jgi:Protein of unknown function (DUF3891)
MIIRRAESRLQLITQPDHAALAWRIIREWDAAHFPESPRKRSILNAIEHHDDGWAEADAELIVDGTSGRLLDFVEVPDSIKRETSWLGIEGRDSDPYAGALMAQHRLHVYRRHVNDPDWGDFFSTVADARDRYLRAAGSIALDQLLDDYRFVRAGDLASLAFCNNWASTDDDECGYAMRLEGTSLLVVPDPFGGRAVEIRIDAREVPNRPYGSLAEVQQTVAAAKVVTLSGVASSQRQSLRS